MTPAYGLHPDGVREVIAATMWEQAHDAVVARLARIEAGVEKASPETVRALVAFVGGAR